MLRLLSISFFALLCALTTSVTAQTGAVAGVIIDRENNQPVSFANISIDNARYGSTTGDDGIFYIGNIDPGVHLVAVSRIGYRTTDSLQIVISPDDTIQLRIELSQETLMSEEVVVTAARRNQTVIQAPASVSLITASQLQQRQIQTFDQAFDDVPGVVVTRSSGSNVQSLSIRGASETAGGGTGNRVLLLIDGRPALSPESGGALWNLVPLGSLERIEVVKGANSSLFGSSAVGGVINAITRKPTVDPRTTVHVNYGFYGQPAFETDYNAFRDFSTVQLSHSQRVGKFSYLLDAARQHNDGHREKSGFTLYNLFGKVQYHFANNRSLKFTGNFNKINNDTPATWLSPGQPYEVAAHRRDDFQDKTEGSADLYYEAVTNNNLKYSSRFYYYQNSQIFSFNDDPDNDTTNINTGKQVIDQSSIDTWRIGNLSQIDYAFGEDHYAIAGVDIKYDNIVALPDTVLYGRHRALEVGVYAQDEWSISDKLTLTAGLRFDYYEIINEFSEINLSPKLSLVYEPNDHISARAIFARAFRNAAIAERFIKFSQGGGLRFDPNPNLVSEKLVASWEVGSNFTFLDNFSADVAVFRNQFKDLISFIQVSAPLEPLVFRVVNLNTAVMQGAEIQLGYTPFSWLTLRGGYAFLDARDTSPNRRNNSLAYKPRHTYSFSAVFNYKRINLAVQGRGRSAIEEVFIYPDSNPDANFLLDSKLTYSFSRKTQFYVSVNNITDNQYEELERYRMPGRSFSTGLMFDF